jgi:hypothetical protein
MVKRFYMVSQGITIDTVSGPRYNTATSLEMCRLRPRSLFRSRHVNIVRILLPSESLILTSAQRRVPFLVRPQLLTRA